MPARCFHWMQLTMSTVSNALLSEQQAMIRESARRVAQEVVAPTAAQRDQASQWPRAEIEAAAGAGIDSIEHGTFADEGALKAMKAHDTWMVPTLMALEGVRERLGKGIYTPTVEVKARQALETAGRQVTRSKAMGVRIAFGTDAGVFEHGRNGQEFALLVKAGLTNREALASATTNAALALGMEGEIGRIAPDYSADLIAVSGNPLADVRVLEKVDWVMVRGRTAP